MAENSVQIRIKGEPQDRGSRHIIAEGRVRGGQVLWASEENAKAYINMGIAELVGAGEVGAVDTAKSPGPSQSKPYGPSRRKSSEDDQAGRSTDSARSGESAREESSSASQADPASPSSSVQPSRRHVGRGKTSE